MVHILWILTGCNPSPAALEPYPDLEDTSRVPYFSVMRSSESESHIYQTHPGLVLNDTLVFDNGFLYRIGNRFFGRAHGVLGDFALFNLDSPPGTVDTVSIRYSSEAHTISREFPIVHVDLLRNYYGFDVHIFRLKGWTAIEEDFTGEPHLLDVVVFVTKEHGAIGSYLSDETDSSLIYIDPRGDILRSRIDYSIMERRIVE